MSCGNIFTWLIDSSIEMKSLQIHLRPHLNVFGVFRKKNNGPKSETDITLHISHGCLHDTKRSSTAHRWCCVIITGRQAAQLSAFFFFFFRKKNSKWRRTHFYSARCGRFSLTERSVVKSQARAALRSVLGPDAPTCACVWMKEKNTEKACFPALRLLLKQNLQMQKGKRRFVTVSCRDCSLRTRIVVAGCCQTISSYAWLAVKILRGWLWRGWRRKRSLIYSSSVWAEEEEVQRVQEEAGGRGCCCRV